MPTPTTPPSTLFDPLETDPPPTALGYSNPLLAVASEFFKLHGADQRRQANAELDRREKLAQDFDQFAVDPRYTNHPDLQQRAHMHAVAIRQLPYTKKLPREYEPDEKMGNLAPAFAELHHQRVRREIKRNGEPPKPAEPAMPPPPPSPYDAGGTGEEESFAPPPAPPPAPPQTAGAPPIAGGMHVGPNQITPAPGIGEPPAPPPDLQSAPPDPQYESLDQPVLPMTPPEMASFNNSIPASSAPELAQMLGIDHTDPNALIDLRALQRGSSLIKGSADRKARLAIHGLDEDANPLPSDQLSPEQLYKRSAADLAEARTELVKAQTETEPIKRRAQMQHWLAMEQIARQNLEFAAGRLEVSHGRLDLDRHLYGMDSPADSAAGGSGGPSDFAGDNRIGLTKSGKQYVDLTNHTGKAKEGLVNHYEALGVTVVAGKQAEALQEIDAARSNFESITDSFVGRLPRDAGGRVIGGISNTLSQIFQTDEYLAASGAWRTSAIKALRASAGAQGLRLNEAEIRLAVANDIPKITDTVAVALQKLSNMRAQLDNSEDSILIKRRAGRRGSSGRNDYSSAGITEPPPAPAAPHNAPSRMQKVQTNTRTGATRTVYSDDGGATWHP
jgi:hypothetical protein